MQTPPPPGSNHRPEVTLIKVQNNRARSQVLTEHIQKVWSGSPWHSMILQLHNPHYSISAARTLTKTQLHTLCMSSNHRYTTISTVLCLHVQWSLKCHLWGVFSVPESAERVLSVLNIRIRDWCKQVSYKVRSCLNRNITVWVAKGILGLIIWSVKYFIRWNLTSAQYPTCIQIDIIITVWTLYTM